MKHPLLICLLLATAARAAWPQDLESLTLPPRNYVNNGGFERSFEGWQLFGNRAVGQVVQDQKHSGAACLRVSGLNAEHRYLNQTPVRLVPGRTYTLSAWLKSSGFKRAGAAGQVLNLTNYGWTKSASLSPTQPDQEWTRHTITFEAPETSEEGGVPSYTLVVYWPIKSEGTVWIDDIQIEEGGGATDFTDLYRGWGQEALEMLQRTAVRSMQA